MDKKLKKELWNDFYDRVTFDIDDDLSQKYKRGIEKDLKS